LGNKSVISRFDKKELSLLTFQFLLLANKSRQFKQVTSTMNEDTSLGAFPEETDQI